MMKLYALRHSSDIRDTSKACNNNNKHWYKEQSVGEESKLIVIVINQLYKTLLPENCTSFYKAKRDLSTILQQICWFTNAVRLTIKISHISLRISIRETERISLLVIILNKFWATLHNRSMSWMIQVTVFEHKKGRITGKKFLSHSDKKIFQKLIRIHFPMASLPISQTTGLCTL